MDALDLRVELLRIAFRNDLAAEAIVERAKVFEEYVNPSQEGGHREAEGVEPLRRKRGRPITRGSGELL